MAISVPVRVHTNTTGWIISLFGPIHSLVVVCEIPRTMCLATTNAVFNVTEIPCLPHFDAPLKLGASRAHHVYGPKLHLIRNLSSQIIEHST